MGVPFFLLINILFGYGRNNGIMYGNWKNIQYYNVHKGGYRESDGTEDDSVGKKMEGGQDHFAVGEFFGRSKVDFCGLYS